MTSRWWKKLKDYVHQLDEGYVEDQRPKPTQRWNDLLIHIAREIERVMLAEMFEPPGEPTYIPPEYIVFLSPADEAALQGDRRIGFLRGLRNLTAERARQLVGTGKTQTDTIRVEFRVDSSLEEGKFYVKASWDVQPEPTTVRRPSRPSEGEEPEEATQVQSEDEMTQVRRRPLFRLEVRREGGSPPVTHPIFTPEIRLGRGGRSVPVDVPLPDDREISRLHAVLRQTDQGYHIRMEGKNPMFVAGQELRMGQSVAVQPGELIRIGIYTLRIVPDDERQERRAEGEADEST